MYDLSNLSNLDTESARRAKLPDPNAIDYGEIREVDGVEYRRMIYGWVRVNPATVR